MITRHYRNTIPGQTNIIPQDIAAHRARHHHANVYVYYTTDREQVEMLKDVPGVRIHNHRHWGFQQFLLVVGPDLRPRDVILVEGLDLDQVVEVEDTTRGLQVEIWLLNCDERYPERVEDYRAAYPQMAAEWFVDVDYQVLNEDAIEPTYATDGSGCFDIYSPHWAYHDGPAEQIGKTTHVVIKTGLAFEVPPGHVMLVFSRSGHGFNENTRLANCVGVIDSDYRGELKVKLTRDDDSPLEVNPGDRVAQALVLPIPRTRFRRVEKLSESKRGNGGLGHTGR